MTRNRLMALITVATPVAVALAFAVGMDLAHARDASLCAVGDLGSVEAGAVSAPCDAPLVQTASTSETEPALVQKGLAATTALITEPVTRTRHFIYRLKRPEEPSGETIVLLHGSGGDETSLFRLAQRAAPNATLLGVRGRVVQKGLKRWYARISPIEFDQDDIRNEARAFITSLKEKMATEQLDPERTVFVGYSNGANLIAAMTLLHPDLIDRAVLLRAMPVLDAAPAADLHGARFLSVPGQVDNIYGPFAPQLETLLRDRGATVDSRTVALGHLLGEEDIRVVSDWLAAAKAVAGGATAAQ